MAATEYGTAHVFGIAAGVGAITNATVTGFDVTDEHKNRTQVVNELGNEILDRYDDLHKTGTITCRIRSAYTVAAAATQITYNSVKYIITSVARAESSGDFVQITYNIKTSEYITLA
jgi:hypothetical protein